MKRFKRPLKYGAAIPILSSVALVLLTALPAAHARDFQINFRQYAEAGKLFYVGFRNSSCEGTPSLETHLYAALKLSSVKSAKVTAGPDEEYASKPCINIPQTTLKQRLDCRQQVANALGVGPDDIQSITVRQHSKYDTRIVVTTIPSAKQVRHFHSEVQHLSGRWFPS